MLLLKVSQASLSVPFYPFILTSFAGNSGESNLVNAGWETVVDRSPTPTIPSLFRTIYMLRSFLDLNWSNKAIITCMNGKSRTSILIAAYLK